jgi:hypothetical protein
LRQALVWAMPIVMTRVAAQDAFEMRFVHDQEVIEALRSDGAHEPFGKGICIRGPIGRPQDLSCGCRKPHLGHRPGTMYQKERRYLPSDLRPTFGSTCGETRSGWRTRNPGQQSNWSFWHPQDLSEHDQHTACLGMISLLEADATGCDAFRRSVKRHTGSPTRAGIPPYSVQTPRHILD